ncbi:hypothetical protein KJ991_02740 [Patescibacteria group bacterium]|nr:hypothetical protein [Patescibacteria group bacterium]MBU4057626.1 hypothetical protein [Patescibacteria group bacterium]MBU4115835.1 hypothetical protein [Patescibacteria group bacterium]
MNTQQFYHNIITEKSWQFLREFKKNRNFILIGGWAVFLYSRSLKSKDIDIIVDYNDLEKLKSEFDIFKNERLKKYEIKHGEFDVDIYLPHYSDLGVDIEKIEEKAVSREGFSVPEIEILLMLKLYAWGSRRGSVKGQKDELDIFSLAFLPEFNWQRYLDYTQIFHFENYNNFLIELIKKTKEIKELGINQQKMAKIRKRILALLNSAIE